MPIYMPWLTIATAILSLIATAFANTSCVWILPLYTAGLISLLIMSGTGVIKLTRSILFLSFMPILVFLYVDHSTTRPGPNDLTHYINKRIVFRAIFLDTPTSRSANATNQTGTIRALRLDFPEQKPLTGKARLIIIASNKNPTPQFKPGQVVQIEGQLKSIGQKQEPWLSGLETTSKRNGIFSQICATAHHIKLTDNESAESHKNDALTDANDFINQLRQRIANLHLRYLGTKTGSLLASMVLGDRAVTLDIDILNAFRKVGLSHIVAASGFNLTIVTFITYWILRRLFTHRLFITFVVCANVIFYALLAGLSASVVRSAIACLLLLLVHLYYRKLHSLAALAIVLFINLIADPAIIMDLGAQLSYAAVTGIIIGAESLTKTFSFGSDNKIVNLFASSLAVILLAQMAVFPIQLYHFWQASFLFLPANLIVDPLVAPITVIGFISSFVGLLDLGPIHIGSCFCQLLDLLASIPLQIIIYITDKLASSNLAVISTGQPGIVAIALYYAFLLFFLATLAKGKYRLFSLTLFSIALIFLFYKPNLKQPVIILLPNSTIAINTERKAICLGNESPQTNKILSFYGATLVSSKYDPDKTFQFALSSKPNASIIVNEETQDTRFLLTIPSENNTPPKTYIVSLSRNKSDQNKFMSVLEPTSSLSLAEFSKDLPDIDVKICCPQNSVGIRILTQ